MKNKELAELLKYSSPYSILVVSWRDKLVEMFVPITVRAKQNVGELKKESFYKVTYVKLATNMKMVFIVNEKPYFASNFDILIGDE